MKPWTLAPTAGSPAKSMTTPAVARRRMTGIILIAVTLVATGGHMAWRSADSPAGDGPGLDLARPASLLWVDDGTGRVRQAASGEPGRDAGAGPVCQRVYAAGDTLICLKASGPLTSDILVYGRDLKQRISLSEWGLPSRARVSPSGNLVAWTLFRTGDSYLRVGAFATTAGVYDLVTGAHYGSLEDFSILVDGQQYSSPDVNFWGVTFAADDQTFYATLSSKGKIWLVAGDLAKRQVRTIREGIECPSLSPDGTRIAYKKRTGDQWRIHVLDLATGADVALADTAHVDDQPAWLDGRSIGYARPHNGKPAIFTVAADGTGEPRLLLAGASSPAALP